MYFDLCFSKYVYFHDYYILWMKALVKTKGDLPDMSSGGLKEKFLHAPLFINLRPRSLQQPSQ